MRRRLRPGARRKQSLRAYRKKSNPARLGYWQVEREWEGKTVCIIGGGPSLTEDQVRQTIGQKTIALNNGISIAPHSDILWFCDPQWALWHSDWIQTQLARGITATLENVKLQLSFHGLRCLRDYGYLGLSDHADGVTHGHNSGYQAIGLAVHLGARRIILLGYDMRVSQNGRTHWHPEHPIATPGNVFTQSMLPAYRTIVEPLKKLGVEVINTSLDSALTCFKKMPLEEALQLE